MYNITHYYTRVGNFSVGSHPYSALNPEIHSHLYNAFPHRTKKTMFTEMPPINPLSEIVYNGLFNRQILKKCGVL